MESPDGSGTLSDAEQRAVMTKITWRLVPLLFVCYVVAYIDRMAATWQPCSCWAGRWW